MDNENIIPWDVYMELLFKTILYDGLDENDLKIFYQIFTLPESKNIQDNIISYFDYVDDPFDKLRHLIGFLIPVENFNDEEKVKIVRVMDERLLPLIEEFNVSKGDFSLLNSACCLYALGITNMANNLARIAGKSIIKHSLDRVFEQLKTDSSKKEAISLMNKKNASGPKNNFHDEIIKIMVSTWDKYPNASKNGMVEKILHHFGEGKISRATLNRWIKTNNFGPKKIIKPPTAFNLVIPS